MSGRKSKARSGEAPHPVDVIAGRNLHIARTLAGYTQQRLGAEVGLTFQQIQKYENAKNRMSISRAWEFSKLLGIGFSAFVEGADDMPTDSAMSGPQLNEWLTLYARVRKVGQLREITEIAARIVELCERSGREPSRCR
jgi:transcriptional regulator with XRE-family HTH domain